MLRELNQICDSDGLGCACSKVTKIARLKFTSQFDCDVKTGPILVLGKHPGVIDALLVLACLDFRKDVVAVGALDTVDPISKILPASKNYLIPLPLTFSN